jgi:hypothetical protein
MYIGACLIIYINKFNKRHEKLIIKDLNSLNTKYC